MVIAVGDDYKKKVEEASGEVFVRIYGPWCGYSKKLEPTWIELANELSGVEGLTFVDYDKLNNEVEGLKVTQTP